eukprot:CAMPEP_0197005584 /NCGR_PEP_ID=MMETSP1380-20130617/30092_1 /TAXON_ID=5936 /ORGANISM="Euplotes crassus, Strain CT5" /LENGTH=402 /DNA_ID=CAMNT_0042424773 /DNA_START=9 /DNA_END=1217 /DNA_ORIENTATION=+
MFSEVKDDDQKSNSSSDLSEEVDDVLGEPIPEVQPSTAEKEDMNNFEVDGGNLPQQNTEPPPAEESHKEEEESHKEEEEPQHVEEKHQIEAAYDPMPAEPEPMQSMEPVSNSYYDNEEAGENPVPQRKYSSPPASIYDDNTEDGRIRLSDAGETLTDAFSVSDPVKGSHVTYTVRGYDDDGPFEGARRYNDFFNLRAALLTRWPGVYIPPISPKKALGNKDDKFLDERKHFLQRFLILTSKIDHIIKSDEFRLFSRPSGEIDKAVQMLPQASADFLLDRYKTKLNLAEEVDSAEVAENRSVINEWTAFCKTFMKTLKHMRDSIKPFVNDEDRQNKNYGEMMNIFTKFEQGVLMEYCENDTTKHVVPEYEEKSQGLPDAMNNPIREFFYWIKGEIYDLQALND